MQTHHDLIKQWRELKKEAYLAQKRHEQLQAQLSQLKEQIVTEVFAGQEGELVLEEDNKSVTVLSHKIVSSTRFDSKALKDAAPSLYKKFEVSYSYSLLKEEVKPKQDETSVEESPSE